MLRKLSIDRNIFAVLHDFIMAALSFVLALYMRLGPEMMNYSGRIVLPAMLFFSLIALIVFILMRQYRGLWRYASMQDLLVIARSVSIAIVIFYISLFLLNRLEGIPRSLPFIHALLLMVLLGGSRFAYRIQKDRGQGVDLGLSTQGRVPVLMIGANSSTAMFIRETRSKNTGYVAVGIVDEDKARIGRSMHGVRIYGNLQSIPAVVSKLERKGKKPQRAILTDERVQGAEVREIFSVVDGLGLTLARLPRLTEFKAGVSDSISLQSLAVEDLLGRSQKAQPKSNLKDFIAGKVVMVTGAGGTIGGELTRQVAAFGPAKIVLFEHSEYHLYEIDMTLAERFAQVPRESILGDVRDGAHLERVVAEHKPDIVFHAAAIKHVPVAEANPEEAVLTNVVGTRLLADACAKHGVGAMVLISTDKAVNPANVMGAAKRLAESYAQAMGNAGSKTQFVTVRFGNVLGSTGSVVPLFKRQIERGGPVTITDPGMVRYFMTVREAVELVISAAAMASADGGENGRIFVLDMGQAIRIEELALQMIRLAGLRPHEDIKIEYTGLRPGEKLYEELFHLAENSVKTPQEGIMLASPRTLELAPLAHAIELLKHYCQARERAEVIKLLQTLVPEYKKKES